MLIEAETVAVQAAKEGWGEDGKRAGMSVGVDRKVSTLGRSAPERGHGACLEPLAQLGDALGGVGALSTPVEAAELVVAQAAKLEEGVNGL